MHHEGTHKRMEKNAGADLRKPSSLNAYIVSTITVMHPTEFASDGPAKLNFMTSRGSFATGDWRHLTDRLKGAASLQQLQRREPAFCETSNQTKASFT